MKFSASLAIATALLASSLAVIAIAQPGPPPGAPPVAGAPLPPPTTTPYPHPVPPRDDQFSPDELLDAGHRFFGGVSRGLAMIVQRAGSQWGQPNGYILGEEAGGAFVGGLR